MPRDVQICLAHALPDATMVSMQHKQTPECFTSLIYFTPETQPQNALVYILKKIKSSGVAILKWCVRMMVNFLSERLVFYIVTTMGADDLVTQGVRASAAMVLTYYFPWKSEFMYDIHI